MSRDDGSKTPATPCGILKALKLRLRLLLGTPVAFHGYLKNCWTGAFFLRSVSNEETVLDVAVLFYRSESMSTSVEIYEKVASVLVEALNVDEDEVTPSASLQGDLGAESIDFLDIVFRMEREFGIQIPRGELFPESVFQGDPEFVREGRVTDQGMGELRSRMPYADFGDFDQDRRVDDVPKLFTVEMVTRYIAWKLGQGANAEPNGAGAVQPSHASSTVQQD
jgi:acyl carrier protein